MIRNVMFQTDKSVVKTKPNIIDEHCIRNDDGVPAVIDEKIKLDWKSYHEKLLNTMFAWDESSISLSRQPSLLNRQRHGQKDNQQDEQWKSCRVINGCIRYGKDSRRSRS